MSLSVTLGYPMMVCSQVFRVYRHVMNRRLVHNARNSSNHVLQNLSCSYTSSNYLGLGWAIYFIAAPNAPLAIVLAVNLGYMVLLVWVNTRTRVGFVRS